MCVCIHVVCVCVRGERECVYACVVFACVSEREEVCLCVGGPSV